MKCAGCKFYCEHEPAWYEGGASAGQCRIRSTPGVFPYRRSDDWCGEFVSAAVMVPAVSEGPIGVRDPLYYASALVPNGWTDR